MKTIVDALVQKSGPALIALAFILLLLVRPLLDLFSRFLQCDSQCNPNQALAAPSPSIAIIVIALIVLFVFLAFSVYAIRNIPVLQKSDADYALSLRGVFGGVATDSAGAPIPFGLSENRAIALTNKILQALGQRASNLGFEGARANIFILEITDSTTNHWCSELVPDLRFSYNMEWGVHSEENKIRIPFGVGSSGMSFKYTRAVFCYKKADGKWQHMDEERSADSYLSTQLAKVHKNLKWILSMPVPSRLSPRYMVKAILNLDCLGKDWDEKKAELLRQLAIDASVAAALIGLLNKSSGHIRGLENEEMDPSVQAIEAKKSKDEEVLKQIDLDAHDFDPRDCPAPSSEFLGLLASKPGLGRLAKLSPQDISEYFKQQLSL